LNVNLPRFSAIIPVYNGETFLAAAMQSVLALEYEPMELIIVDDGSTDATPTIATSLIADIRYARQSNQGPAAARNLGLRIASGDVVGFLDADDLWSREGMRKALTLLASWPEVGIVQGHIQDLRLLQSASAETSFALSSTAISAETSFALSSTPYAFVNIGSAVYRKAVFESIGGFDETMRFCEDYDWFLRAFDERIPKLRIQDVTLFRRRHSLGMTHGKSLHEIGMARAHKKAIDRRRRRGGHADPAPAGFPSVLEYIGTRGASGPTGVRAEALRNPAAPRVALDRVLQRRDDKPIDVASGAILCFMCVRNESLRLPYCLSYHRRLGVSRFFVVDNASTDDTVPFLLAQPDVHVWDTDRSFGESRCGTDWTERLLREYGVGHWCLILDPDELLYYARCEERGLRELCGGLDEQGKRALMAILLDMYSDKPIKDTSYRKGQDFLEVCPYFDRQFYHYKTDNFFGHDEHPSYFGGMRQRVFGGKETGKDENHLYCLNKVPLIKYDPSFVLSDNLHWTNCPDVGEETGCLLHFKYFATFPGHVREEAERGQHWNAAIQYVQYANAVDHNPELTLFAAGHSVKFRDHLQLQALGILNGDGGLGAGVDMKAPHDRHAADPSHGPRWRRG
jgi:hypothetical protein